MAKTARGENNAALDQQVHDLVDGLSPEQLTDRVKLHLDLMSAGKKRRPNVWDVAIIGRLLVAQNLLLMEIRDHMKKARPRKKKP